LEQGDEGLLAAGETASEVSVVLVFEHVVSQTGLGGELLFAFLLGTDIRGFFGMDPLMVVQGVRSLEGLVATVEGTDIRSGVGVGGKMSRDF